MNTKFVTATGTEKFPVIGCITTALRQMERLNNQEISFKEADPTLPTSPSTLESIAERTIKHLELGMIAEQKHLEDLKEKVKVDEESPDDLKEMFWGKDWRVYSNKLKNRLAAYDKVMSSYAHSITILQDNMYTDDLDTACEIVEFYLRVIENIPDSEIHKIRVGDKIMYKLPDIILDQNTSSNSIQGRHMVLERFDPVAWES